jgi:YCII-related domain
MDTYLLVHRHPQNYTGSPEAATAWEAWFDKLGDALVDKGNPVLDDRSAVGKPGTVLPLGGYTIINAANLEEATQLAHGCPALQAGGAVEVGRLTPSLGRQHPARTF